MLRTLTRSKGATAVFANTAAPATVLSWNADSLIWDIHLEKVGSWYLMRSLSLGETLGLNGTFPSVLSGKDILCWS